MTGDGLTIRCDDCTLLRRRQTDRRHGSWIGKDLVDHRGGDPVRTQLVPDNVVDDGGTDCQRHGTAEHTHEIPHSRDGRHVLSRYCRLYGHQAGLEGLTCANTNDDLVTGQHALGRVLVCASHKTEPDCPECESDDKIPPIVSRLGNEPAGSESAGCLDEDEGQDEHARVNRRGALHDLEIRREVVERRVEGRTGEPSGDHRGGDGTVFEDVERDERERHEFCLDEQPDAQERQSDEERSEDAGGSPRVLGACPGEGQENENGPGDGEHAAVPVEFLELFHHPTADTA